MAEVIDSATNLTFLRVRPQVTLNSSSNSHSFFLVRSFPVPACWFQSLRIYSCAENWVFPSPAPHPRGQCSHTLPSLGSFLNLAWESFSAVWYPCYPAPCLRSAVSVIHYRRGELQFHSCLTLLHNLGALQSSWLFLAFHSNCMAMIVGRRESSGGLWGNRKSL